MFNVHPMGLGKTIKELRQARGWTLEKLEEESGVAVGTISALENRDSARSQYFPQLARALGVTMEQLGSPGLIVFTHPDQDHVLREPAPYASLSARGHPDDLPEGDFVTIPRLGVRSAGDQVEVELVKDNPQIFRVEWIRQMGLKPAKLAAMKASGDSMDPTVCDGDSLLVDTSQTAVIDGKIYALWYDGGERVKRLFRLPGGSLRIVSDNPRFPVVEVPPAEIGHVRIIGRIVHRSTVGGL